MKKEKKFYDVLKDIFVGAKIEGKSGYINLMHIKSNYFEKGVFPKLKEDVKQSLEEFPEFREELFEKLYTFFNRYFSESGSIYFKKTHFHKEVYDKIYTNKQDVVLFWKTHMLYYIKSEILFENLIVKIDGFKFNFDVSNLEHTKAYEKRDIVYQLKEFKENNIVFSIQYSTRGKNTNFDNILKKLRDTEINDEILSKSFRVFEKQNEIDYFINKNAKEFLKEQFNHWFYYYLFSDESDFSSERIKQLKILQDIAYKIIDFISQFEDELLKIWKKLKFVLNSNYVITLDRLASKDNGIDIIRKILKVENFSKQIDEWIKLKIIKEFNSKEIFTNTLQGFSLNPKYLYLPIDTKFFNDLKFDILSLFENIDNELDGWLIKSENWQALNTLSKKYKSEIKTIYIDPPFNKKENADYLYKVNFKDAIWITLLENRLKIAKDFLSDDGAIFVRCDYNGNMYLRLLMNEIFGMENFRNEITISRTKGKKKTGETFPIDKDSIFLFSKTKSLTINELSKVLEKYNTINEIKKHLSKVDLISSKLENELFEILWLELDHRPGERKKNPNRTIFGKEFPPPKNRHWIKSQVKLDELLKEKKVRLKCKKCGYKLYNGSWEKCSKCEHKEAIIEIFLDIVPITESWLDIKGYSQTWDFQTENSEELLKRVINSTSKEKDIVMDFFLGCGTTTAVAHKLRRRWIGVDMGEHYYTHILKRMKKVLGGEQSGISKTTKWKGGGFFKYFEFEQYEDSLRKAKYEKSEFFDNPYDDPYNTYIFLKDEKMLETLKINPEKENIEFNLTKLYSSIDLPETISHSLGKMIKTIENDIIEFEDGEKLNLSDLNYSLFKPYIWW